MTAQVDIQGYMAAAPQYANRITWSRNGIRGQKRVKIIDPTALEQTRSLWLLKVKESSQIIYI